jgi:hypothetical protein
MQEIIRDCDQHHREDEKKKFCMISKEKKHMLLTVNK